MHTTRSIFLAALAAAAVLSCASQGAQPSRTQATEQGQTTSVATPPEQAPAQAAQTPQAPAEDSLTAEEAPPADQAQAAEVPLGLPPAPQARTGPEVETVESPGPAGSKDFPLTTPQPPPATPAKKLPPRVQSPAAEQVAAQSAAPPSRPQTAGAQPSPAPRAAAAPQSQGAAPSSTYGKLREIYAREGDDVQISLDGEGFLFLGFPDRSPDGMSFKGKETRDGKTLFSFKALKLGTYDLDFLRQDNSTGTSAKETVRVHVVTDADFAAAVAQGQEQPPESVEPGDPAFADKLSSLGQYDAALAELLKGYRDGNPDLNDRIARLYLRTRAYDAAAKYFSKNLGQPGRLGDSAVLGLAEVALAQKDQPELLSLLKRVLAVTDPGLQETLIAAVRLEKEKQETGLGIDLASEYLRRYPDGKWIDEAEYLLARLLEADSQFRDIARARETYQDIVRRFPESPYAADAHQRVEYIDRHFLQVR